MATQCAMIIGYLVPHQCENRAVASCGKCGRRFCEEHVAMAHGNTICTACQQGLESPVTVPKAAKSFAPEDYASMDALLLKQDHDGDDMFADLS